MNINIICITILLPTKKLPMISSSFSIRIAFPCTNMTLYYTDYETSLILLTRWCLNRWVWVYDGHDFKSKCICLLVNTQSSLKHFEQFQLWTLLDMYKSYTNLIKCARIITITIFSTNRDALNKIISRSVR